MKADLLTSISQKVLIVILVAIKTNIYSDRAHLALSKNCNIFQNFMIF